MKSFFVVVLIAVVLSACSSGPETVEVTRLVKESTEVEVTRLLEREVTREVEVTRLIEVEVTTEVEVPVEIEVTRIVQEVVTATPVPSLEPTATDDASASSESGSGSSIGLLQAVYNLRSNLETFGGYIDAALGGTPVPCISTVQTYDRIANAPTFSVTGSPAAENAYNNYRQAVSVFTLGSRDLAQNCRDFIASGDERGSIPFQQWGMARQSVNDALDAVHVAVQILES